MIDYVDNRFNFSYLPDGVHRGGREDKVARHQSRLNRGISAHGFFNSGKGDLFRAHNAFFSSRTNKVGVPSSVWMAEAGTNN
ncbi:hypothetical protein QW180_23635 [Vibrio sinaloensis]|nr:hypothetical protein [Vibrio sinaloensis]